MPSDEESDCSAQLISAAFDRSRWRGERTRRIICSLTEQKFDAWLIEDFDRETRTDAGGHVP